MRILALDLGDVWTGVAVSDPEEIICKPLDSYKTVEAEVWFATLLQQHQATTIVFGLPLDQYGGQGLQAQKTLALVDWLKNMVTKKDFHAITFIAWDERRTSKLAAATMRGNAGKMAKTREHAVAAALILQNYLDFQRFDTPTD